MRLRRELFVLLLYHNVPYNATVIRKWGANLRKSGFFGAVIDFRAVLRYNVFKINLYGGIYGKQIFGFYSVRHRFTEV